MASYGMKGMTGRISKSAPSSGDTTRRESIPNPIPTGGGLTPIRSTTIPNKLPDGGGLKSTWEKGTVIPNEIPNSGLPPIWEPGATTSDVPFSGGIPPTWEKGTVIPNEIPNSGLPPIWDDNRDDQRRTSGSTSFNPGSVNQDTDTVQGQLGGLLSRENPLMQRAYYKGLDLANSRGLLNSSMASEAAQAAMMDVALPIAQQDAAAYFDMNKLNTNWGNEFSMQRLRHNQDVERMHIANQIEQEQMLLGDSIKQTQMELSSALGRGDMVLAQELQSLLNEQQYQFQAGQAELDRLLQILLAEQQYGSIGTDVSWNGGQNPSSSGSGSDSSGASGGGSSGQGSGGGLLGDAWKQSENYRTINHYFNTVLGRDVQRAGFDYWNEQLNNGMGVSEFRERLEDSEEARGTSGGDDSSDSDSGSSGSSDGPPPSVSGNGPYTEYLPEGFEPSDNVNQLSYRLREHVKALGNPELTREESIEIAERIVAGEVSVWEVV